jgi:Zn-dependent protease with chaperone function
MDFFEQQDKSRSKTGLLVFLFICAVLFVIAAVYAAIMVVMVYNSSSLEIKLFNPKLFFTISGVTLSIILVSSITKIIALSKGGSYVAESLGGRLVNSSTQNPDERKLLNVVEEMAIASGVPVPPVYVLNDEKSINAFAAGFSPNDAVVAVTLGCCNMLSRDELQGVVAHEFSHVLNGDMRLNIRLIGFLSGIMIIATVGQIILRSGSTTRRHSHRSRSSGKGGGQIFILALLFLAIGYIGVLLGRLIQSAVSRQREYLADASAVQFTRNPSGIASALKKIGGFSGGSKIISPSAGETCHMFFSSAISSLFSTHPPLPERIQRIEPGFNGVFEVVKAGVSPVETSSAAGLNSGFAQQAGADISVRADTVLSHVGNISPENVARSAEILAAIPVKIKEELNDILGASAIVCALLLDKGPGEKIKQMELLKRSAPLGLVRQITIVEKSLKDIDPRLRLPVLDLAIPTLRQMSFGQYENLKKYINILVQADSKLTIFEFSFKEVITHRLDTAFTNVGQKISYKNITTIMGDAVCLLTALARVGHTDKKAAEDAFRAAISNLPAKREKLEMDKKTSFGALHTALKHFAAASSGVKKTIFDACSQCVLFDKKVSISEAELLRAVAYSMDIPVPPFLSRDAM